MGDGMENLWKHTAESIRDTFERESVWRANSTKCSERARPVTYQTDKGLLLCESIRNGGTFRARWKINGKVISRDSAAQLMAERMESKMGARG